MDRRTFLAQAETLLAELEPSLPPGGARSIRLSFEHGEEGLGLDELLATIVNRDIPVSGAQRDVVRDLIDHLDLGEHQRRRLRYVSDASVERLTVVDVP